ncbi:hypothetical protein L6164_006802 [Bauhinia variegata]|uniref:Uncharacterized protein n=1 Tax=Bauhinia variegata TaxID=167791 RepID=A0ACB9Q101_BAUVA|nr:hypothetical protein L6164_006802 [Bauhinia variegata]
MSSEEANSSEPAHSPSVEELNENLGQRLSQLVSRILRISSRQENPRSDSDGRGRIRIIMFNASSGNMIVFEGPDDVESIFQELAGKSGVSPATQDSIDALPKAVVTEEGTDCPICLEDNEIGSEVKEMPCKHRFHSGCIEKWLGIHGSCPICRFLMPVAENKSSSDAEDGGERLEIGEIGEGILSVSVWARRGDPRGDPMDLDSELNQDENSASGDDDSSVIEDMELA